MNKLLLLTMSLVCVSVFAHDANTVAFYPFTDGTAGSSLDGRTVANDAGEDYGGTYATRTADAATFSSDIPGRYVFDSDGANATLLCENAQSIHFDGTASSSSNKGDQLLTFANLGSAVAGDKDFTLELFFKIPRAERGGGAPNVPFFGLNCGFVVNEEAKPLELLVGGSYDQNFYAYFGAYTYTGERIMKGFPQTGGSWDATVTWSDGYWHHCACVYVASTKKLTLYLDYAKVGDLTKERPTGAESGDAYLGNGNFRGFVSCVRLSDCARDVSGFLRCSSLSTFYPKTVFHYSFDGANGSTPSSFPSADIPNPFEGQYIGKSQLSNSGTAIAYGDLAPTCTNEIPFARKTLVLSGDEVVAASSNALHLAVAQGGGAAGATGIKIEDASHYPLTSGSFTLEGWFRLDWTEWKRKTYDVSSSINRLTLMGQKYGKDAASDFAVFLVYQSSGFAFKLTATGGAAEGTYKPSNFFMDNAWHHIAAVYDDAKMLFTGYVDGAPVATVQLSSPYKPRSSADWRFYCIGYGFGNYGFEGLVDEVRLSRAALEPADFLSFKRPPSGLMLILR